MLGDDRSSERICHTHVTYKRWCKGGHALCLAWDSKGELNLYHPGSRYIYPDNYSFGKYCGKEENAASHSLLFADAFQKANRSGVLFTKISKVRLLHEIKVGFLVGWDIQTNGKNWFKMVELYTHKLEEIS